MVNLALYLILKQEAKKFTLPLKIWYQKVLKLGPKQTIVLLIKFGLIPRCRRVFDYRYVIQFDLRGDYYKELRLELIYLLLSLYLLFIDITAL